MFGDGSLLCQKMDVPSVAVEDYGNLSFKQQVA